MNGWPAHGFHPTTQAGGAILRDAHVMTEISHDGFATGAPPVKQRMRSLLETYGLWATRQRLGLAKLLLSKGNRHVTADALAAEANSLQMRASLATVYNVLNLFAQVGIVRALTIEGAKTFFDTNTSDHSHFYFEDSGHIEDVSVEGMQFARSVTPPEGYEIVKVDIVFRLRPKAGAGA